MFIHRQLRPPYMMSSVPFFVPSHSPTTTYNRHTQPGKLFWPIGNNGSPGPITKMLGIGRRYLTPPLKRTLRTDGSTQSDWPINRISGSLVRVVTQKFGSPIAQPPPTKIRKTGHVQPVPPSGGLRRTTRTAGSFCVHSKTSESTPGSVKEVGTHS